MSYPKEFQKIVLEKLTKLDSLEGRFDHLEGRFDGLEGRFDGLEAKVEANSEIIGELKETQDKLIIKVVNIEDTLTVVQQDVKGMKKDISRLNDSVDGFAKRQQKFESEVAAVHSRLDRLERIPEPA